MAKKKLFNEPAGQEREYLRILTAYAKALAYDVRAILAPKLGGLFDLKR